MKKICINKIIGLLFLTFFILVFPLSVYGVDLDVRVSTGNDDAEEVVSTGNMSLGSSDLEMSMDSSVQLCGVRFQNVTIPVGAVITNAKITFRADGSESDATSLIIVGEDTDNAGIFTTANSNISGRTPTSASVSWNNIASWTDGVLYDTPDLTSIVQEIVSRGGWASGNAMVFVISGSGQRRADTYNETTTNAPLLHVEYTTVPTPYIQVSTTTLNPTCLVGNDPAAGTFTLTNSGTANLNYSITDDAAWLSVAPASGVLVSGASAVITVTYVANTMGQGTYDGIITVTDTGGPPASPNSPVSVNVTLEVQVPSIDVSVSANSDDAEEDDAGGMDLYSSDLELITEATDQIIGIRFQNIAIPPGVAITKAYIEFDVDEDVNINPTNFDIYAQAADNPATFTTTGGDISSRPRTAQFVEWDNLPDWNNGEQHRTSDLKDVVQAVVGRAGWASGNAMVFIINGSGKRVAESYDGDGAPPKLHIEYVTGSFPNISLDNNNFSALNYEGSDASPDSFTITNSGQDPLVYTMAVTTADGGAWLSVSDQADTGTLNAGDSAVHTLTYTSSTLAPGNYNATITITGAGALNSPYEIDVVLTVNAVPEPSSCGDVPLYAENLVSPAIMILLDVSSSMTSLMNVSSSVKPQTPDISTIVQELVNQAGWVNLNSMVFKITGTGHRTASSYDGNSGGAALLHVEFNDGTDKEIDIRVSQGTDDAEESSGGSVGTTSSDLELVDDGSDQTIGIRFQNVAIPKDATITNAYIEFEIDEAQSEVTNLTIHGQANSNPSAFVATNNNISSRANTTASVAWNNVETWDAGAQKSRIEIGKDVISELVKDRSISWGFGTWCARTTDGYTADIEYTKIHVGCRFNDDEQQAKLQAAIAATTSHSGTPFDHSINAARQYFNGDKKDQDGAGEIYNSADCQPMFLIDITDGLGNGTVAEVTAATNALCDINVSPIAVGFGIDNAVQINEMAKVSNERGNLSDDLYAMHDEVAGVGQPFFANNEQELIDTLETITKAVKTTVFTGSAPAPTTSVDQGNMVIVAQFNAGNWSGELEALVPNPATGVWDTVLWKATEELPATRKIYTIDPDDGATVFEYSNPLLNNDNYFDPLDADYFCASLGAADDKPLGPFINSVPIIVGDPAFYYDFDDYDDFKPNRIPMVYIGSNDGALHAFSLDTGEEKWAFVPLNLHEKLDKTDDPEYNICSDEYCHQYLVDGSPQVADVYDEIAGAWKTILICGERAGGDAYFALDITTGIFDDTFPYKYLWEFRDTNYDGIDNDIDGEIDETDEVEADNQLGETWSNVSISRVDIETGGTTWGAFFGSGYSSDDQENKEAYLYGVKALDKSALWVDGALETNRIKLSDVQLLNDAASPPLMVDYQGDYISDSIYVGNLYGTMRRVSNIGKGQEPVVNTLFNFSPQTALPSTNPISAKAAMAYGEGSETVWIYYGTGNYQSQADKTSSSLQYFFGLKDTSTPNCYLYTHPDSANQDPADPLVCGDLSKLEARYITGNVTMADGSIEKMKVRYIEGICTPDKSWVLKLYNGQGDYGGPSGADLVGSERVIKQPLVAGGIVFFTTYIPDPDICKGNGKTWLFALDYNTGCAPGQSVFDLNEDGKFDENDKMTGISVVAIPIEGGPGSKPVLGPDNTLFITTPVGGLNPIPVNIPGLKVKLNSWKDSNY